jgi:Tol biopolymer transport system component
MTAIGDPPTMIGTTKELNLPMNRSTLLLFACLLSLACRTDPVQPSPDRQFRIAFTYFDSLGTALATVHRSGSNLATILRLTGTSFNVRWSPDGSKLAFDLYNVQVGVVNADGSQPELFGELDVGVYSWFADSKRIAFSENDTVFSFDVATGIRRAIGPGIAPEVSPAGDKIAFLLNHRLFLMNPDGTEISFVADSVSGGLAWSPDGERIAFVDSAGALVAIARNSSGKIHLTQNGTAIARRLSWSPDGMRLAYEHVYGVGIAHGDGSGDTLIAVNATSPSWCPDGSVIIYHSAAGRLIMVKPDGTDFTQVTELRSDFAMAWSPVPLP